MKKILFAIFLLLNTSYVIFAQVSNDDCATAQVITIPSSGNICINSTTVAALGTTYTSHPCFPLNQNIPDVWFTFITTGASNTVTVSPTGTPAAKKLGVSLNTSGCASSVLNTCNLSATNGGTATATWTYPLGTQVWINVSSITLQGGFQLCITSVTAPPAPGNTCGTATTICNKNNFSLATFPANSNPYTPDCFPTALQRPVFYQFTVGKSGTCIWTATPTGTVEYDWVIYDITSGCPGTVVCCNFNYGDGTGSPIGMSTGGAGACGSQGFNGPTDEFSPAASVIVGKTYLLVIDNYSNNSVGFDFTWGGTMEIAPTSQFTATPTTACGSSNVTITNTSIAATDWDWNFGDGATLNNTQNPPIHAYASPGTYLISLVTTSSTGCQDVETKSVIVKPNPTVVISGGGNVCSDGVSSPATQNVVFTMTGTGPYNFTYAIAGVSQTPLTNQTSPYTITADHTKAGAYTLVTLTDNGTGCSITTATGSATITSISCGCAQPTITPGTPVAVCKGSTSTTFTYSGITNSPDTYSIDWDATANGVGFVDVVNATLSASPLSISLPAGAAAATYTGSLTVTNTGTSCTSIPQNISLTINGQPTITPGTPVAVCKGSTSTTFTYSGITNSPDTYSIDWDATANGAGFADVVNTTLSASPLSISLPAGAVAATYTGSLTVTNTTTSCTSIPQNISVIINPLPSVTVNSPSICGGTNATLTATPTIAGTYSFAWTVQAPETNPGDMASFSVSTAGVYSVIITNTTTTCSSTSANGTVTIKPLPTSNITGGGAICPTASSSVNIALTGTAPWSVTYTDGTTPVTVPNILTSPYIINTSTIGVFSVTAVSDGNSCNATSFTGTATVTLKPLPSSTISGGGSVCMGTPAPAISIALIGTGPWNLTYSNGTTSTPATAATSPYSITNPGAGTYSVTALSDANCTGTSFGSSVSVVVKPIPTAIITGGGTSCIGDPINPISIALTGLAPWTINYTNGTTPNTITSGISPYVISNPTAGTYSGVSVSDANNCSAVPTGNATVTINPKPTVIVNSQSICIGESATLYATPSTAGGNYLWTPSGSNNDSLIVFPAIPTTYTVSYTLNSCSNSASGTILVSPLPEASFSAPLSTSIFNPVVNFTDNSLGAISWNWNFGDMYSTNNTSFLQNPKHTYSKVGTYCVKLDIENIGGCTDSYTMCVIIDPEFTFYVPNAFTPNNDGTNDEFFGQGWEEFISGFEMYIFDRWGNSIFHTEDITKHWDGKVNGTGEVAQEDEYVYVINVKDSKGEKHKYIGGVTLVK